ncbi:MAG: hypothetical protein ACRD3P_19710 [Terriglobales bacterium]
MRDIAITAGVNDTLPVIAKAGSAAVFQRAESGTSRKAWVEGKPKGYAAERFPKRESVVGTQGVAASSENGLA